MPFADRIPIVTAVAEGIPQDDVLAGGRTKWALDIHKGQHIKSVTLQARAFRRTRLRLADPPRLRGRIQEREICHDWDCLELAGWIHVSSRLRSPTWRCDSASQYSCRPSLGLSIPACPPARPAPVSSLSLRRETRSTNRP